MAMLSGIAKRLVDAGVLPALEASTLLDQAAKEKKSFVQQAVGSGKVRAIHAALAASQEFGLPLVDLAAFNPDHMQPELVKDGLIEKNHAIPLFKRGNKLYIGQSDPANLRAVDEIKFATGMTIDQVVVEEDKLLQAIDRMASGGGGSLGYGRF
jgi:type IV pilus assembly protein PilB